MKQEKKTLPLIYKNKSLKCPGIQILCKQTRKIMLNINKFIRKWRRWCATGVFTGLFLTAGQAQGGSGWCMNANSPNSASVSMSPTIPGSWSLSVSETTSGNQFIVDMDTGSSVPYAWATSNLVGKRLCLVTGYKVIINDVQVRTGMTNGNPSSCVTLTAGNFKPPGGQIAGIGQLSDTGTIILPEYSSGTHGKIDIRLVTLYYVTPGTIILSDSIDSASCSFGRWARMPAFTSSATVLQTSYVVTGSPGQTQTLPVTIRTTSDTNAPPSVYSAYFTASHPTGSLTGECAATPGACTLSYSNSASNPLIISHSSGDASLDTPVPLNVTPNAPGAIDGSVILSIVLP